MQVISTRHAPPAYVGVTDVRCPCCQGNLVRERRRVVDRLRSLIRPVKRYRCENFACQWLGNLTDAGADMSGAVVAADAQSRGDMGQTTGVPISFVVHMVLVAFAIVFVIVYCTMEPAPWFDGGGQVLGSGFLEAVP